MRPTPGVVQLCPLPAMWALWLPLELSVILKARDTCQVRAANFLPDREIGTVQTHDQKTAYFIARGGVVSGRDVPCHLHWHFFLHF